MSSSDDRWVARVSGDIEPGWLQIFAGPKARYVDKIWLSIDLYLIIDHLIFMVKFVVNY